MSSLKYHKVKDNPNEMYSFSNHKKVLISKMNHNNNQKERKKDAVDIFHNNQTTIESFFNILATNIT